MKSKRSLVLVGLCLMVCVVASATMKKKPKTYFKLIEAYSQRMIPGIPGAQIKTNYQFTIVWQGIAYPETFFWRGENGWLTCRMTRKQKTAGTGSAGSEVVMNDQVRRGDTLELVPLTGGRFAVPPEIPQSAKNTLFFKTGGSGWLSFPVKKLTQKPDILLP
jgi:hypothetical protein